MLPTEASRLVGTPLLFLFVTATCPIKEIVAHSLVLILTPNGCGDCGWLDIGGWLQEGEQGIISIAAPAHIDHLHITVLPSRLIIEQLPRGLNLLPS